MLRRLQRRSEATAKRLRAGLSSWVCGLRRRPSRRRQAWCRRWTRWPTRMPTPSRPIGCSPSPCATSSGLSPISPTSQRMQRTGSCGSSPRLWRTRGSGTPPRCGVSAARLGDECGVALVAVRRPKASVSSGVSRHVSRAPWRHGMARWPRPQPRLGDLASAEVLRSVAAEAAALFPAGEPRRRPPTPWCRGGSRRLRPAARCPRRPRRRLRYLPARGRGSGRGRQRCSTRSVGRRAPCGGAA